MGRLLLHFLIPAIVLAGVSGCGPANAPETNPGNAAQQANRLEPGVVLVVRTVGVATSGAVSGATAGGIGGSQADPMSAFGFLVAGGPPVPHETADTTAFEYIVRKAGGDLVSVSQRDRTPLALGQKVLVVAGLQARVVPD